MYKSAVYTANTLMCDIFRLSISNYFSAETYKNNIAFTQSNENKGGERNKENIMENQNSLRARFNRSD